MKILLNPITPRRLPLIPVSLPFSGLALTLESVVLKILDSQQTKHLYDEYERTNRSPCCLILGIIQTLGYHGITLHPASFGCADVACEYNNETPMWFGSNIGTPFFNLLRKCMYTESPEEVFPGRYQYSYKRGYGYNEETEIQ